MCVCVCVCVYVRVFTSVCGFFEFSTMIVKQRTGLQKLPRWASVVLSYFLLLCSHRKESWRRRCESGRWRCITSQPNWAAELEEDCQTDPIRLVTVRQSATRWWQTASHSPATLKSPSTRGPPFFRIQIVRAWAVRVALANVIRTIDCGAHLIWSSGWNRTTQWWNRMIRSEQRRHCHSSARQDAQFFWCNLQGGADASQTGMHKRGQ